MIHRSFGRSRPEKWTCRSRKQSDIRQVLEGWGCDVLEQIVEVSIDLSGNYRGLVEKMLPNADIVADRFHVTKLLNQELNIARNAVLKVNEENQDKTEKSVSALKQSKYALLKPENKLTKYQKNKLKQVQQVSPLLAKMHRQKEAEAIFDTASNGSMGL